MAKSSKRPGCFWCKSSLLAIVLIAVSGIVYGWVRFGADEPVVYEDLLEHFKYGSTGGERGMGFPKKVWHALPELCPEHLPGPGYESLGMLFEPGHDLPVGMSQRRHLGIDRVFVNCAVCHSSTVRTSPDAEAMLVVGMGANRLNFMAFEKFFHDCIHDSRFLPKNVVAIVEARSGKLSLLDRYVVYPIAIYLMRDRVTTLLHRLRFVFEQPDWGPGRVDTFSSAKALFNFPFEDLPEKEKLGTADFPVIWNQAKKTSMQLHWDGNNDRVEERNLNAAFGTGAMPPITDHDAVARMQAWNSTATPPSFADSFPIDPVKAKRGAEIYSRYCADCHGASGANFEGKYVGRVTHLQEIRTDPYRLYSFTRELAENLGTPYAGTPYRFSHFRKTFGYANLPIDGLWLRAPYLHNGSVPTMWDLLQPAAARPQTFYRGNDLYDPVKLGFVSETSREGDTAYFYYDTSVKGNWNTGHEGPQYGTELPVEDKWALIEHLKTF